MASNLLPTNRIELPEYPIHDVVLAKMLWDGWINEIPWIKVELEHIHEMEMKWSHDFDSMWAKAPLSTMYTCIFKYWVVFHSFMKRELLAPSSQIIHDQEHP